MRVDASIETIQGTGLIPNRYRVVVKDVKFGTYTLDCTTAYEAIGALVANVFDPVAEMCRVRGSEKQVDSSS